MLEQILYTASITPFNATGDKIDYSNFERLLRLQETAGNGIVLLGSTGEGLSLTDNERKKIVTFACDLKLKSEIIVGVPSHNINSALDWLNFCNDMPIQGYLMTTPIYTKPGVVGQTNWFEKLLNLSNYPAMLYNVPSRTGIKLHPETIRNLQNHERLLAIKDSSGTVENIVEYKIVAPDIAVYCGDDYMMPTLAIEGATGLVSIAANAWPKATRRYATYSCNGEKMKDKIWWQACKALFSASNPIPIKALLKDLNLIDHDTVRLPLCIQDLPSRQTLLEYNKIMMNWEINHE